MGAIFSGAAMSATTTLRLPEDLKKRIAAIAGHAGKSPHNYMLDVIAAGVDQDEARQDFHALADARLARLVEAGEAIAWSEMRTYLRERAAGRPAAAPKPQKLAR